MTERIAQLHDEAEAAIAAAPDSAELEELRVRYLGRKAELPNILRGIATLPPEQRGSTGKAANQARQALEALIAQRAEQLAAGELEQQLRRDVVDVTLPGTPPQPVGHLHLLTATRREIEDVFLGLGAPPPRSHRRGRDPHPPPLSIPVPGRVYRRDSDATHTPQFHQIEGLAVDEDITLADLKGTLLAFARAIFGSDRKLRLRPHFFPFTEPSVEVDVSCFMEHIAGRRCRVCKDTGWVEILGSGMVDPNVFGYVREYGYDPERIQGFAFGMGIERIAMLKHGVPDLRLLYDNDVRFLEQFG